MQGKERHRFNREEIVSYLEWIISIDLATEEEEEIYQDYKWNGKLVRDERLKRLQLKMKKEYDY